MSEMIGIIQSGKWEGKRLKLIIGQTGADTHAFLDDKNISDLVLSAHIDIEAGDVSKLRLKMVEIHKKEKV